MLTDAEIMAQVLAAFQEEQREHCQSISTILLDLECDPQQARRTELLTQLFREAHSMKGGARAAGLDAVEQIAHSVEDIFSAVRDGKLTLTSEVCDPIYAALDAISMLMAQVAAGQPAGIEPHQPLLDGLATILQPEAAPAPSAPPPEPDPTPALPDPEPTAPAPPAPAAPTVPTEDALWEVASSTVRLSTTMLDSLLNETGELLTSAVRAKQHARDADTLAQRTTGWRRTWRQVQPLIERVRQQSDFEPVIHHLHDRTNGAHANGSGALAGRLLVSHAGASLIDALLQANMLLTDLEEHLSNHSRTMGEDSARLSAITNRLQDQIRRTRMLPLATLFNPLRVQLREMSRAAGKQVVLETDDGSAEADRQVLDSLREVLLHLMRNAVDHGIEPPAVRVSVGKPAGGHITLRAVVNGDYLALTVADDGAGLDIGAIMRRAVSEGFLSDADSTRVGEEELIDLIFRPGFSTRKAVDKLSGRGVGLDIVRSSVERMHGRVSVESRPGAGCTFAIRVPLSLTSSHGLLLQVGQATYMLPLESVQRIVPVTPQAVRVVEGHTALNVDGKPLMLIRLADLLGISGSTPLPTGGGRSSLAQERHHGLALLLGSGERQVACVIDAVLGEQELVVHRLPLPLQRVRFITGATILADGQVVPILDQVDLLRAAIGTRGLLKLAPPAAALRHSPTIVVVDDSITTRTLEKNILEAAGYQVQLATDGAEALQLLRKLSTNGGCDLLLSDIDMPNLNGFDLTSQVRNEAPLKHLPIVLVTSLDTPADRERGMSAGADAYIVKRAFDQQILLDTIARLIDSA